MLIKDVLAEGPNARDNDYQKAILASRSRMPASKGSTSKDCDQVRKSYIYFACNRYEGLKDEDPAFISAEDAHKERIKSIRNSNGTGSGGQAN